MTFSITIPVAILRRNFIARFFQAFHAEGARASSYIGCLAGLLYHLFGCDEERMRGFAIARGNGRMDGVRALVRLAALDVAA